MARFPHELHRDGLFAHAWTLKGPLLAGRFQPPRGDAAGVYQSATLRLEYRHGRERRQNLEFRSPRLSRGRDQIIGEVRWAAPARAVLVSSNGTGSEAVEMPVLSAGLLKRRHVLLAPHGQPLVAVIRRGTHFDVDVPGGAFAGGDRDKKGRARLYEAAIAMLLATKIDQEMGHRARIAGATAGAGAAAGAAAAAHHVRRKRSDPDG